MVENNLSWQAKLEIASPQWRLLSGLKNVYKGYGLLSNTRESFHKEALAEHRQDEGGALKEVYKAD